jgi:hypothetical protein
LGTGALASSCATTEVPDWETFYRRQPRSILVLPVENESTEAEAPRFFMSTIARPLIARGYYVFPVEGTAEILQSEGLISGAELRAVRPERYRQYFGADGVLLVTIKSWDTSYAVLASSVTVTLEYFLVDTRSGDVVWSGVRTAKRNSGGGGAGIGALVAMAISAAMTAALTDYVPLAREANAGAFLTLPPGMYHPEYESTRERLIGEWREFQRTQAEEES